PILSYIAWNFISDRLVYYCPKTTVFGESWQNGQKAALMAVFVFQKLCHNQSVNSKDALRVLG
ncbi:MAG: hypothetical protein WA783_01245, partial [Phormidesmis sp.]